MHVVGRNSKPHVLLPPRILLSPHKPPVHYRDSPGERSTDAVIVVVVELVGFEVALLLVVRRRKSKD